MLLALIFAGILISYVDRGNLSIAAATIMRDFRLPPASMGVLLSAFFWTYGAFQIPAGFLVDRLGIRRTYAAAFLIWSLASAGMALSRGAGDLFSARLVLGLAETVGPVASLAFIRQHFAGREQGLPLSIYVAGQTFGPACGALLGSMLLVDFGWRFMFAAIGLVALLWVPAWLFFTPRKPNVPARAVEAAPTIWPWRTILSSPAVWAMSGCVFFFSYYWYFVLTWMPTYLTSARGFSTLHMGEILSIPLFSMAGVNIAAGWLADKLAARTGNVFRVRLWFAAAGLLGAALILVLNVMPGRAPVLPILVVSICSFGVASSSYWAIAQFVPPVSVVGRTVGYLNTLSQIGGIAAPLITGWSLGPQKNFELAILLAGVSPLVSCVLLFVAGPRGLAKLKERLSDTYVRSDSMKESIRRSLTHD
ncbi:MAG: MFS transporter [Bryobacteraceae bacterium]